MLPSLVRDSPTLTAFAVFVASPATVHGGSVDVVLYPVSLEPSVEELRLSPTGLLAVTEIHHHRLGFPLIYSIVGTR